MHTRDRGQRTLACTQLRLIRWQRPHSAQPRRCRPHIHVQMVHTRTLTYTLTHTSTHTHSVMCLFDWSDAAVCLHCWWFGVWGCRPIPAICRSDQTSDWFHAVKGLHLTPPHHRTTTPHRLTPPF